MYKYRWCLLMIVSCFHSFGQIAHFNQYPTMSPVHEEDAFPVVASDNLSFAFSLRKVIEDYEGPLVRLRRGTDGAKKSFYPDASGLIDVDAINTWRGTANVFVLRWYSQGGISTYAGQGALKLQPQFYPDANPPYIAGDGINDKLIVNARMQFITNKGKEGTILGFMYATEKNQFSFGVVKPKERWTAYVNFSTSGLAYFDGGSCCTQPRSFSNPINSWGQYTFIRGTDYVLLKKDTVLKNSGSVPSSDYFSKNLKFVICAANGANYSYSSTRFTELILYNINMETSFYEALELNMMNYWEN